MPGPSNILLIEGSFSELADELAQFIDGVLKPEESTGVQADAKPVLEQIHQIEQSEEPQSVDQAKLEELKNEALKKIVTKASALNNAPEKEFTAAYNLLISLCSQSSMRDQLLARICQYLEQPIPSSASHGSALAIATLTTVFNVLPSDSESRYHVFLAIVKVIRSRSSQQAFNALIPQLEANIDSWTTAWQLDDEDVRNLYTSVADVAAASGDHDLSYKYNLRALETIAPATASETEARDLAKKTLAQALSNPTVTDFTPLTASDAIQALRKSDGALFELLEIFSSDDYSSYADFLETNELSKLGFSESAEEVLDKKIHLLTLASIAASTPTRSVPYSTIASALQIPAEDVEMWVIDTIRAGLVEGKLSQLRQEFLVQRATYRVFGEKQWAEIQGRLMVWRRSLESVLQVVRAEREKFLREGPGNYDDQGPQRNGWQNEAGQRRQGGRRNQGTDRSEASSNNSHERWTLALTELMCVWRGLGAALRSMTFMSGWAA